MSNLTLNSNSNTSSKSNNTKQGVVNEVEKTSVVKKALNYLFISDYEE